MVGGGGSGGDRGRGGSGSSGGRSTSGCSGGTGTENRHISTQSVPHVAITGLAYI